MSDVVAGVRGEWRVNFSDALGFWEPARIGFNLALAATTAAWMFVLFGLSFEGLAQVPLVAWFALVVLAAIANALYCAAYPVDLLLQASTWRAGRPAWRAGLWLAGTALAISLASLIFWSIVQAIAFDLID